ncbi:MAG TPA: WYL domain-containing protein [Actinophytocola sp.]|jgi:hypothetical protein|nr:WYL domain-containing protein [Actinophytocola sp.]
MAWSVTALAEARVLGVHGVDLELDDQAVVVGRPGGSWAEMPTLATAARDRWPGRDQLHRPRRAARCGRSGFTARVSVGAGAFVVPAGFDHAARVPAGIARTPWRHEVPERVRGDLDDIRARLPRGIAVLEPVGADPGWVRVRIRIERLDWVPRVLVALDAQFVVGEPDGLRDSIRALAGRLPAAAGQRERS